MNGTQNQEFGSYSLWLCQQFAIEHGPVEIVSFPMKNMVDLSIVMLNYQRVTCTLGCSSTVEN